MSGFASGDTGPPEGLAARGPFVEGPFLAEDGLVRAVAAGGHVVGVGGVEAQGEGGDSWEGDGEEGAVVEDWGKGDGEGLSGEHGEDVGRDCVA